MTLDELITGGWWIENPEGSDDGWEIADAGGVTATVHGEPDCLAHRQAAAAVESLPDILRLLDILAAAAPRSDAVDEARGILRRITRGEFIEN